MVILNLSEIESRKHLHQYLKESLELPEYYGSNLDALYDLLTEKTQPLEILVEGLEDFCKKNPGYGKLLTAVLERAEKENENLTIILKGCGE